MKIGQTSAVLFVSKLVGSALGFVSTLYMARVLGAEIMGIYALVMSVVGWLVILSRPGIGNAMIKRISEGEQQGEYLSASIIWIVTLMLLTLALIFLSQSLIGNYINEFESYVSFPVIWFVVVILIIDLFYRTEMTTLVALRKVHINGLLRAVRTGLRSFIQILLVIFGFGLFGMLMGYILSTIFIGLLGLYWIDLRPSRPTKSHFKSLFDYFKFSWLGGLKTRAFNETDIILLGVFVPTSLVGVYSVAWSLAVFLGLFSKSISLTLFPEISNKSVQETKQAIPELVDDSISYAGLIAIPGLVGGFMLGERLLRLYGDDFTSGATVLVLLILSIVFHSYQNQLMNALNALDRPDLTFRINAIFITLNIVLNIILIWQFGFVGAAVATSISACLSMLMAYYTLSRLIRFGSFMEETIRQVVAAVLMGVAVWAILEIIERNDLLNHNFTVIVLLVTTGSIIYFTILLGISEKFRETVDRNLRSELPI